MSRDLEPELPSPGRGWMAGELVLGRREEGCGGVFAPVGVATPVPFPKKEEADEAANKTSCSLL